MRCWLLLGGGLVHDFSLGGGLNYKMHIELNNTSSMSFVVLCYSFPDLLQGCNEFFGLRPMLIYIQRQVKVYVLPKSLNASTTS